LEIFSSPVPYSTSMKWSECPLSTFISSCSTAGHTLHTHTVLLCELTKVATCSLSTHISSYSTMRQVHTSRKYAVLLCKNSSGECSSPWVPPALLHAYYSSTCLTCFHFTFSPLVTALSNTSKDRMTICMFLCTTGSLSMSMYSSTTRMFITPGYSFR